MYIGLGPEAGGKVRETDAFAYACERCVTGTEEERRYFLTLAKESSDMLEFAEVLVSWYYSGNWMNDTVGGEKTNYIIRFEDNSLQGFFGTYLEALKKGREETKARGMNTYVVS